MDSVPDTMYCEQLKRIRIYFINTSDTIPIGNLRIASNGLTTSKLCFNHPNKQTTKSNALFTSDFKSKDFQTTDQTNNSRSEPLKFNFTQLHHSDESYANSQQQNTDSQCVYSLDNVVIAPQGHYELDMWIRAPETVGEHHFYFMFFYEDATETRAASGEREASPGTRRNLLPVNGLRYRVVPYELAVRTVQAVTNTALNVINSEVDSSLILNFEISNNSQLVSGSFKRPKKNKILI